MDFLADRVILLSKFDDFPQLRFELPALFPQRDDLPFADRDGPPPVRVRNIDLREHVGILLKKLGMILQVLRHVFGFHFSPRSASSSSPSNTVAAGPVI